MLRHLEMCQSITTFASITCLHQLTKETKNGGHVVRFNIQSITIEQSDSTMSLKPPNSLTEKKNFNTCFKAFSSANMAGPEPIGSEKVVKHSSLELRTIPPMPPFEPSLNIAPSTFSFKNPSGGGFQERGRTVGYHSYGN
ncbi:hypothetical protein V6N12_007228 [Hibiscus sabdariffa]|uniref:Uncharacterized protein n=1 Tax=Hibiscus sabdariffa TaxID=183260 RepID=A0ABR2F165_9ROSI